MRKRKVNFPVRPLFFGAIIFLALSLILGYIWRILTTADYFQIKDIVSREAIAADLSYLKGRNIFRLDLPRESEKIVRDCPDCSRVRLARILPNRLYVEFIRRRPLALIKLYRYFAVDENGVIFSSVAQPDGSGLPVISGLETKIFGPKPGSRYENKELSIALSILKETARNRLLKYFKIQRINIAGIDNITVQFPLPQKPSGTPTKGSAPEKKEFLEVKMGQANIGEQVVIMAGLINQEKNNLSNIKYIDLRFREPVIKFKDVK